MDAKSKAAEVHDRGIVLRLINAAVSAGAAASLFGAWFMLRSQHAEIPLYLLLGALAAAAAVSAALGLRKTTFVLSLVAFVPMGAYLILGGGLAFVAGILTAATLALSAAMLGVRRQQLPA